MVRLKVAIGRSHIRCHPCFNSIVVRLKGQADTASDRHGERFQFHSGSIKRYVAENCMLLKFRGFNSIVVRLKGIQQAWWILFTLCGFNSIVVRLKGDYGKAGTKIEYTVSIP